MTGQDHPPPLDIAIEPTSTALAPSGQAGHGRPGRRLKIWEIPANWLCSVIGTCLTPADLQQILKRSAIRLRDGAYDYEIHGYVVGQAQGDGRVGREINKMLDHKYRAMLRKVADEKDEVRLAALWDELCTRGLVAGAYWAFISQAHVPEWLKTHAFGEVHMLSHFMGGFNRQSAKELWLAEREVGQLAQKLAGQRRRARDDLAERDQRIAALEHELQQTRSRLADSYRRHARRDARSSAGWQSRLDRGQRRLAATRARLRAVEQENQRLAALVDALADVTPPSRPPVPAISEVAAENRTEPRDLPGGCILYVGGRCHLVPHLRARAEARAALLLHHDGGRGETLQALESLIDRADVVFCPIDCISHHACLKAKHLCRRLAKPFVPLRSSSATCFARAVEAWHGAAAGA
jgi:Uncharacterized protein conserved in bacteria (DUF2325)